MSRRRKRGGLGYAVGERMTLKQVRKLRSSLERVGQSDLRAGECRKITRGVIVCRNMRGEYRVEQTRRESPIGYRR